MTYRISQNGSKNVLLTGIGLLQEFVRGGRGWVCICGYEGILLFISQPL